jgi:phosphoribosylaminoimidazole carboxylase PurE protein
MAIDKAPQVGIIMGSDSDLPIMKHAGDTLGKFDVPHEYDITSAHRTPERMARFGREAAARGIQAIIAGAGGSAHLPGMMASETRLPVLGVAIESAPDPTNAAFGSMIRMPEGAPLATMGKNKAGAVNAALEAVRILALSNPELAEKYEAWMREQAEAVGAKGILLRKLGADAYLAQMPK